MAEEALSDRTNQIETKINGRPCTFVIDDALQARYSAFEIVGAGRFGVVARANDTATGTHVAVKQVLLMSHVECLKGILREVYILKRLNYHNIIGLNDTFCATSFDRLYLVLPYMPTDLHQIIEGGRDQLTNAHIKWLTYSILCGLACIHSAEVIHRDLKPQNILVDENCNLKICDFGQARIVGAEVAEPTLTRYVVTCSYRAPEIAYCDPSNYGKAIDIWCVGCILAEMFIGGSLLPACNDFDQIPIMLLVFGSPLPEELSGFNEKYRTHVSSFPQTAKRPWSEIIGQQEPNVYDLLSKLLAFAPRDRLQTTTALDHPYFDDYRAMGDRRVCAEPLDVDMVMGNLSVDSFKRAILSEIRSFRDEH